VGVEWHAGGGGGGGGGGGADDPGDDPVGALRGGEIPLEPRYAVPADDAGTWTTLTMTAGVGRADCTGAVSAGIGGTGWTGLLAAVAAAKPTALTAESAPVTATTPETPPIVHEPTLRSALSRSSG
jgi:hypothetical protein